MVKQVFTSGGAPSDYLYRVVNRGGGVSEVGSIPTDQFVRQMLLPLQDCETLAFAVRSLQRQVQFQSAYADHLVGVLDDDEFAGVAEQLAYEPRDVSAETAADRLATLERWLPEWNPSASDVAALLQLTPESVEAGAKMRHVDAKAAHKVFFHQSGMESQGWLMSWQGHASKARSSLSRVDE